MPYNSPQITSLEDLQREQFIVRERLKTRQSSLQNKMYQIPGELAAAGVNSFIPKFLRGKVTNAALSGGKKLINGYFAPDDGSTANMVSGAVKKVGLLKSVTTIFKLLRGK